MAADADILDRRILAMIGSAGGGIQGGEDFGSLALDLFDYQYRNNSVYHAYCDQLGKPPDRVRVWRDIPALWPIAWRMAEVCCFDPADAVATFLSSGTTGKANSTSPGEPTRSRHRFDTLELYKAALAGPFAEAMLGGRTGRRPQPILVLMPSPADQPNLSLSFMMGEIVARFGLRQAQSRGRADASGFFARGRQFQFAEFAGACERASTIGDPVVVASTAFGWVTLLEWLAGRTLPLPAGSRIMETGGYKGRSVEWSRAELYERVSRAFGVERSAIVSEYGMCELSSQFYSTRLGAMPATAVLSQACRQGQPSGEDMAAKCAAMPPIKNGNDKPVFLGPAWTAVLAIDAETQRPVPPGQPGLLRVIDLANRGSAIAVQTEDVAIVRSEHGPAVFELIGRAESAEPKGCSLTAEDFVRGEKGDASLLSDIAVPAKPGPLWSAADSAAFRATKSGGIRRTPKLAMTPEDRGHGKQKAMPVDFAASREGDLPALAERLIAAARPAESIDEVLARVEPLAEVARRWLTEGDPIREEALAQLPKCSPFPRAMWGEAIDAMFGPITAENLRQFVLEELAGEEGLRCPRLPRLVGVVLAGNVPAPAVQTLWVGALAGCGQLVKPASDDPLFPALLVGSIAAVDAELAGRIAIAHWPGGSVEHNAALARSVETVVAFGRRETIESWRQTIQSVNPACRLIAHGPRTSLALIEVPAGDGSRVQLAERIAFDVAMYDQQGCLSPQQVYLAGDEGAAVAFARLFGQALAKRQADWPCPSRELGVRLAIRRVRETHRVRRIIAPGAGDWLGEDATGPADRFDWTLLGSDDSALHVGPGGRTVFLTRVDSLEAALDAIRAGAEYIQGVAIHTERGADEFEQIAAACREQMRIPYCCRPGELQRPPFGWRNDNVRPLRSLA